jgi:hypothetical protein
MATIRVPIEGAYVQCVVTDAAWKLLHDAGLDVVEYATLKARKHTLFETVDNLREFRVLISVHNDDGVQVVVSYNKYKRRWWELHALEKEFERRYERTEELRREGWICA